MVMSGMPNRRTVSFRLLLFFERFGDFFRIVFLNVVFQKVWTELVLMEELSMQESIFKQFNRRIMICLLVCRMFIFVWSEFYSDLQISNNLICSCSFNFL